MSNFNPSFTCAILHQSNHNGVYKSENMPNGAVGPLVRYGTEHKASKIFVDFLTSSENCTYRGVGTALMQAVMEYGYSKGCDGRVELSASWSSHTFYYKLGMRAYLESVNKILCGYAAQKVKQDSSKLRSVIMRMPAEGIKDWKERIQRNPVFSK